MRDAALRQRLVERPANESAVEVAQDTRFAPPVTSGQERCSTASNAHVATMAQERERFMQIVHSRSKAGATTAAGRVVGLCPDAPASDRPAPLEVIDHGG